MDCRVKPGNDERISNAVPAALFLRAGLSDPFPPMKDPGRHFVCPGKEIKEAERRQARISNLRVNGRGSR